MEFFYFCIFFKEHYKEMSPLVLFPASPFKFSILGHKRWVNTRLGNTHDIFSFLTQWCWWPWPWSGERPGLLQSVGHLLLSLCPVAFSPQGCGPEFRESKLMWILRAGLGTQPPNTGRVLEETHLNLSFSKGSTSFLVVWWAVYLSSFLYGQH